MRNAPMLCFLALLSSLCAAAQIFPASTGSCSVAASGAEGCNWMSGVSLRKGIADKHDSRSTLFVTRFILAPGARLDSKTIVGPEVLIVGRNNGEVVDEKRSPFRHINVYDGSVMLMSKKEPYLLRNVGKEEVELLVIEKRR